MQPLPAFSGADRSQKWTADSLLACPEGGPGQGGGWGLPEEDRESEEVLNKGLFRTLRGSIVLAEDCQGLWFLRLW